MIQLIESFGNVLISHAINHIQMLAGMRVEKSQVIGSPRVRALCELGWAEQEGGKTQQQTHVFILAWAAGRWHVTCSWLRGGDMRVLLTTDGSNESKDALRAASRLLAREDREADVLFVAPASVSPGLQDRMA